jgi:hypothetical protein
MARGGTDRPGHKPQQRYRAPYPGVLYDEVLKVLREARTSVINVRGKSHDTGKLVENAGGVIPELGHAGVDDLLLLAGKLKCMRASRATVTGEFGRT